MVSIPLYRPEHRSFIESACMFGYRVRLTLGNRQTLEGKALDTLTDSAEREYLILARS